MFLLSHVKPSPIVSHSMPRLVAAFSSPTFHFPDLTNWMTLTFQPRAAPRIAVPKAAVDLPLPSPVFTITIEVALVVASAGPLTGTSFDFTAPPHPKTKTKKDVSEPAPPPARTRSGTAQ